MNLKKMDIVLALIFFGMFTGAFLVTLTFPAPVLPGDPGAGFFPKLISLASLFFCILLFVRRISEIRSSNKNQQPSLVVAEPRPFLITVGSVVGLILGMRYVGAEISFITFLFVLLGLRTKRWIWSFVTSLISFTIIYLVFVVFLNVHLPVLFLPKYINF